MEIFAHIFADLSSWLRERNLQYSILKTVNLENPC